MPKGQPVPTEWKDPKKGERGLGSTIPDVGWGERRTKSGQLDLISIPEVSMVGDWRIEGRLAKYALHKRGQFAKYLSAARVRIDELKGMAVSSVAVHIHYISDAAPSEATIKALEKELKDANLPNVTVYWRRI
jgi:hypothetical protein